VKEREMQKAADNYLRMLESFGKCTFIRIPDSLLFYIKTAPIHIKKIVSDLVKGRADLTILRKDGKYLCIELKSEKGKQSPEQETFQKLTGENYVVCRSIDHFLFVTNDFLSISNPTAGGIYVDQKNN
jgi:hypothetical protein